MVRPIREDLMVPLWATEPKFPEPQSRTRKSHCPILHYQGAELSEIKLQKSKTEIRHAVLFSQNGKSRPNIIFKLVSMTQIIERAKLLA